MGTLTAATWESADYEIAALARSVDAREGVGLGEVSPVPGAGELQANVSLANADKSVADGSLSSTTTAG